MAENNKKSEVEELKDEIERLKKELKKRKKYGLVWEDKPEEVVEMCKEKLPVLKEVKDKEIITDKDKPVNLLIEGDNYHALSVLNYTHAGKVDVIYIDPPYNTGNKDFIFNDHYVDREDAYRHSKWLSFMEKRLKLAKNLLKDTGVIFISIDANELAQLKLLLDSPDLFGEAKRLGIISVINNFKGRSDDKFFATANEFLLAYAKNEHKAIIKGIELTDEQLEEYDEEDDVSRYKLISLRKTGKGWRREDRPNMFYPIYFNEKTGEISLENKQGFIEILPITNGEEGRWRWHKETFLKNLALNNILVKKNSEGKYDVFEKMRPTFGNIARTTTPKTVWYKPEYDTGSAGRFLKNILLKEAFDNPKSIFYISDILRISTEKNSTVLDFMAGSGTTGHAVLELNKEDGGNRQFILCTNNENNICTDVCYPRIKKVIEGYKNLKGEQVEGLGGNLKYFRTDFIDAEPSDKNKIKLTHQATEMLCIKEGTFEKVIDNGRFKIFKNSDHYTGIIWDQTAIPEFKEVIKNIKAKFSVYIFSLGEETFDEEFADIKQKVNLSPIPEAILRVYRRIFK
jgi:adenine-specific DNA-methyltransferase